MKRFILLLLMLIISTNCSTFNNEYIFIQSSNFDEILVESENLISISFPFKTMIFAFSCNYKSNKDYENIDIYIKDYNFLNQEATIATITNKNQIIEIEESMIDRVDDDFIRIKNINKSLAENNSIILAQRPRELIRFSEIYSRKNLNNNRYFIYVQGTNPVIETVESIRLRPIVDMVRENYVISYAFLYNLGFSIHEKSEKLAEFIKNNIPEDAVIDIIGESQGALVTRNMMMNNSDIKNQIRKFISLCGVNEGAYLANEYFVADILREVGKLNSNKDSNIYNNIVNGIDNITFRIYPELLEMREGSDFISYLNENLTEDIASKMYFIAANFRPETDFGDLMARVSSELLMSRSDLISDKQRFIIPFMFHAQAIFSKYAAEIMYKILNDLY